MSNTFKPGDVAYVTLNPKTIQRVKDFGEEINIQWAETLQNLFKMHGEASIPVIIASADNKGDIEVVSKALFDAYGVSVSAVLKPEHSIVSGLFGSMRLLPTAEPVNIVSDMVTATPTAKLLEL